MLVIPSNSAGLAPHIAMDLYVLNSGMVKLGYYVSDFMAPIVINDIIRLGNQGAGNMTMPAEVW